MPLFLSTPEAEAGYLCEFKASLHTDFWDSQSYTVKILSQFFFVAKYYTLLNFSYIYKTNDSIMSNVLSTSINVLYNCTFR